MLITLIEAARRLDLSPVTVRAQVHNGRIAATKIGRDWLVDEAEVERYRTETLGRIGRPVGARDRALRRRRRDQDR
jgi:excisionase family DNA binding protein